MQISGGSLYIINSNRPTCPVIIQIYPDNLISQYKGVEHDIAFNPSNPASTSFYPGLIQFEVFPTASIIGLQNGAVVTNGFSQTGGSTMLSEPQVVPR